MARTGLFVQEGPAPIAGARSVSSRQPTRCTSHTGAPSTPTLEWGRSITKPTVFVLPVILGIAAGVLGRTVSMRRGAHNFPTWPHGTIIHLFLGLVASVLGSFLVVAIATMNVTGAVFLGLGTASFHSLRSIEREYLTELDKEEVVPRGRGYVEGMSLAFEARDFLVFVVGLTTTAVAAFVTPWLGIVAGGAVVLTTLPLIRGHTLQDIATFERVEVGVADGNLCLGGAEVHRVSPDDAPIIAKGFGCAIVPKSFGDWLTLQNLGQQQAIRHDFAARFGRHGAAAPFWPLVAPDSTRRRLLFFSVAEEGHPELWLGGLASFTVLETAYRSGKILRTATA